MFGTIDSGMHSLVPLWLGSSHVCQFIGITSTFSLYLMIYDLYSREFLDRIHRVNCTYCAICKILLWIDKLVHLLAQVRWLYFEHPK